MSSADSSPVPHVHVDILVVKDGKILLGMPSKKWLQGEEKLWGIPGDDIRETETVVTAVERNLRDLFDAKHRSITILGTHENFEYGNHYIGTGCLVEMEGDMNIDKPSEDWDEWRWFSLDALPEDVFVSVKMTLGEYRKFRK